jgi:hypothetical protein
MARYKFKCTNIDCEQCEMEFSATFPMADVGKVELYPKCECCGELTQKVFEMNGAFKLKGGGWFSDRYNSSATHDIRGNALGDSIQIGPHWRDRE